MILLIEILEESFGLDGIGRGVGRGSHFAPSLCKRISAFSSAETAVGLGTLEDSEGLQTHFITVEENQWKELDNQCSGFLYYFMIKALGPREIPSLLKQE